MKLPLLLSTGFFVSCSSSCCDSDSQHFDSETIHVSENHHVRLMKFDEFQMRQVVAPPKLAEKDYSKGIHSFGSHGVDLGMADVPVLDQGQYGTCVTFSSTAALDALLGQGDFISQQCSLELDQGLGFYYWNGASYPSEIINPLQKYGVVEKSKCDQQYPSPYSSISSDSYVALADVDASSVISSVEYEYSPTKNLDAVKEALAKGHRVLMGFQIQNVSQAVRGFDIKVDGQQYQGGLWACKQGSSKNYCATSNAGHEVVIIGYDDDQELLKIRNSWSASVGDQGNYYMSYAFFNSMTIDQTEVW